MKKSRSSRKGPGPIKGSESGVEPRPGPDVLAENVKVEGGIRMQLRWLVCGSGNVHVVGPCPDCYATQGGLLLGTVASTYKGRIAARCVDCGKTEDYYVDANEGKIWRLDEIIAKGVRVRV